MLITRPANQRGKTENSWLTSWHSFSFADYYDPKHMGFNHLRVINEDIVQPGRGFATHPHRDMEIITYVVAGALEHKDSMNNGSIIQPGEIQRMSAGTGVTHSEFNHSETALLHLLQIWILPKQTGLQPSYEQKTIAQKENQLVLIGSGRQQDEQAITIHQDVDLFVAHLTPNHVLSHPLQKGEQAWLQLIKGEINCNAQPLTEGDGAAIIDEQQIQIKAKNAAEFLLFVFA